MYLVKLHAVTIKDKYENLNFYCFSLFVIITCQCPYHAFMELLVKKGFELVSVLHAEHYVSCAHVTQELQAVSLLECANKGFRQVAQAAAFFDFVQSARS